MAAALTFIALQLVLLWVLWYLSTRGARDLVYRIANPYCWLIGFYLLWFVLPQFTYLAFDQIVIGMEAYSSDDLDQIYRTTQLHLLLFLGALVLGAVPYAHGLARSPGRDSVGPMLRVSLAPSYRPWLYAFLIVGLAGSLYVASKNVALVDGFRSEIMRTTEGKIATALSYLGAFSFVYLSVRLRLERRHALLMLLFGVYAGAILLTGARGRLLFPLAILGLFLVSTQGRVNIGRIALYATAGLVLLLALDPIVKTIKFGVGSYAFSASDFFAPLVYRRNFDGFGNFGMIVTHGRIPHDWSYLLTGVRSVVMETYHARIWSLGVGFGSTIPGLFWLAGGTVALVTCGALFSALLGAINLWLRTNRSNLLFWSYLFAMPWLCALGGNIVESLDKMLAALIGPVLVWLAHGGRDVQGRTAPAPRSPRGANRQPRAPASTDSSSP